MSEQGAPIVYCPRDGSKYYACENGPRFVGCCKLNPCEDGCPEEYLGPMVFQADKMGEFPDLSCDRESNFFSCGFPFGASDELQGYLGCCKSNPCANEGCPQKDVVPAFMERREQLGFYGNLSAPILPTVETGSVANGPPSVLSSTTSKVDLKHTATFAIALVCVALLVILPLSAGLWLLYRTFTSRNDKSETSSTTRFVLSHSTSYTCANQFKAALGLRNGQLYMTTNCKETKTLIRFLSEERRLKHFRMHTGSVHIASIPY
jgi:hypothetical protein